MTPDEAHQLHLQLIELTANKNKTNVDRGLLMLQIKESEAYKLLGYDTFTSYVGSPELKSATSSFRYMKIAKKYVVELGIDKQRVEKLDTETLYRVSSKVTKENVEDWLIKIETLSRSDIHRLLEFGDVDVMTCKHLFEQQPTKYKCRRCGEITTNPIV